MDRAERLAHAVGAREVAFDNERDKVVRLVDVLEAAARLEVIHVEEDPEIVADHLLETKLDDAHDVLAMAPLVREEYVVLASASSFERDRPFVAHAPQPAQRRAHGP